MSDLISRLSEIRSQYNCFSESEEPYYRALSEVIKMLSEQVDGDTISRQAAIDAVDAIGHIATMPDGDKCVRRSAVKYTLSMLPSAQPETEERTAESAQSVPNDELISKKAAIDKLLQLVQDRYAWQKDALEYVRGVNAAICAIEKLPSAQPEIIRCKDCIYYRQEIDMCDEQHSTAHNIVHEDDYCSRAKRREDV